MEFAERYALPMEGQLGRSFRRFNEFKEAFFIRWGSIRFDVLWGVEANIKVILKVYRNDQVCESFIVDTDPQGVRWNTHSRVTRDFYLHPFPAKLGRVSAVKFSYIVHLKERSIPSQYEYIFMYGHQFDPEHEQKRRITSEHATPNSYRTHELDPGILQRDVDWFNHNPDASGIIPKFTRGLCCHPYHPKRFIHDQIDRMIQRKREGSLRSSDIKVCVDCIDDTDFISHLLYAAENGVRVQCQVDWRKMTLTNSENYARLKRSGTELLGVFCTPRDPLIEVAPDMHNKFILFGDEDCIVGSFNITFDRWGSNWETGFTFHSYGVCRLLDNIFQSVRGGVIQRYGIDPLSRFNLLYTFGRHTMLNGKPYRPHHAIISEIHRARHSIRACLFILGELQGEHGDSVVDALYHARRRGVDIRIIFNGHMAREGDPARPHTLEQELKRPLLPAVERLRRAGIPIALAYGVDDHAIPYSPLHSKYCVIDDRLVLDGSFNWYNTSVFSHDILVVASTPDLARPYLYEHELILNTFRVYWT